MSSKRKAKADLIVNGFVHEWCNICIQFYFIAFQFYVEKVNEKECKISNNGQTITVNNKGLWPFVRFGI